MLINKNDEMLLKRLDLLSPDQLELLIYMLKEHEQKEISLRDVTPNQPRQYWPVTLGQEYLLKTAPNKQLKDHNVSSVFCAYYLEGDVDIGIFQSSLNLIVQRHEALRTYFAVEDSNFVQKVSAKQELNLIYDTSVQFSEQNRELNIENEIVKDSKGSFDLTHPPLIRAKLLKVGLNQHVFIIVVSHLIFDEISRHILLRELSTIYRSFITNDPINLPGLPIQFTDYALQERKDLSNKKARSEDIKFWSTILDNTHPFNISLFSDSTYIPSVKMLVHPVEIERQILPDNIANSLVSICKEQQVTLFMLMLSALHLVLHRYTGYANIVTVSPQANRNISGTESLIGAFAKDTFIVSNIRDDYLYSNFLQYIKQTVLKTLSHYNPTALIDRNYLSADHMLKGNFWVKYNLAYGSDHTPLLELPGITSKEIVPRSAALMKQEQAWRFNVIHRESDIVTAVGYNSDLFSRQRMQNFLTDVRVVLERIIKSTNLEIRLSELATEIELYS